MPRSVLLDCHPVRFSYSRCSQIVAIDAETGALQNFQTLSNRARKDVQIGDVKVNAKIFAFDLMHLNGRVSALSPAEAVS